MGNNEMKYAIKLVVIVAIIGLAGCVPPKPPITLYSFFSIEKAKALLVKGNNTIKGSALIRQRNGGVVTCAGNVIKLFPRTEYMEERVKHLYGSIGGGFSRLQRSSKINFASTHPQYGELIKESTCDAQGFFKFKDVADGDFFVIARITWEVIISTYSTRHEGGHIGRLVSVSGGETKEVVLAP